MEGRQLLAVDLGLFFFAGETLVHHKRHFGAVQADTLGTALLGALYIGQQAGVDPQRHAVAVEGFAWQLTQRFQAFDQLALFLDHRAVLARQLGRGVGEDFAVVAVDDQLDAVDLRIRQIDHAHDRGNAHGAGQDRHVRVARAEHRDQAHQLAFGHFAEHRR